MTDKPIPYPLETKVSLGGKTWKVRTTDATPCWSPPLATRIWQGRICSFLVVAKAWPAARAIHSLICEGLMAGMSKDQISDWLGSAKGEEAIRLRCYARPSLTDLKLTKEELP